MSLVTYTIKAGPKTYPQQEGGVTPTDLSREKDPFQIASALKTMGTVVTADLAAAGTSGTVVSSQLGSVVAQVGSLVTTSGGGTGSAAARTDRTLRHRSCFESQTVYVGLQAHSRSVFKD